LNVIAASLVPSWIADNVRFVFNAIRQHAIYQIPNRPNKHCIDCQDFNSHWPRPLPHESIEQRTLGNFMNWSNVAFAPPACFVILPYSVFHRHVYPRHHAQHARVISCFLMLANANSAMKLYALICVCFHGMHFSRCSSRGRARAYNFVSFFLHAVSLGQLKYCQESGWSSISLQLWLSLSSMQRYQDCPTVMPTICHWPMKFSLPTINQFSVGQSPPVLITYVIIHTIAHRRHSGFLSGILYSAKAWNSDSTSMHAAECENFDDAMVQSYLVASFCNVTYVHWKDLSFEHQMCTLVLRSSITLWDVVGASLVSTKYRDTRPSQIDFGMRFVINTCFNARCCCQLTLREFDPRMQLFVVLLGANIELPQNKLLLIVVPCLLSVEVGQWVM